MILVESINKTLEYHELLMNLDELNNIELKTDLPDGFKYTFYRDRNDKLEWAKIHISSKEFTSYQGAFYYFDLFYKDFSYELDKRCFFIEHKGEKIATATISSCNEYGYECLIDWLAIKKEYQGYKLAKPLIYKCLEVAKDLGYNKILLHTQTHTWLAAKLYLDIGFNPFYLDDIKGWRILKTLTNHEKLDVIECIDENEMYDKLSLNVVNALNQLHKDYSYEIWYKDNQNDVFVRKESIFYHYKFYDNGRKLELIANYKDDVA